MIKCSFFASMILFNVSPSILGVILSLRYGRSGYRQKHNAISVNLSFLIFPLLLVHSVPPPSIWFVNMFPCNISSLFLGLVILFCIFDLGFWRKSHLDLWWVALIRHETITPPWNLLCSSLLEPWVVCPYDTVSILSTIPYTCDGHLVLLWGSRDISEKEVKPVRTGKTHTHTIVRYTHGNSHPSRACIPHRDPVERFPVVVASRIVCRH